LSAERAGRRPVVRKDLGFVHTERDPRLSAIPDIHGHAKGEHKPYAEERPLPLTARMLFLWFYHACRRGYPRFLMVADHINYLTFEDPASVNLVRRALKLAQAGDLYGAAETANVDVGHAQVVSDGLRRGMRYSIGAEVDNDPRARPDAQNIVDAMRPDGLIRSVHFIPIDHPVHGAGWNWAFDNPEFVALFDHVGTEKAWEGYMAVLLDAIERLPGNIVGHFFVPAVFGHWPDDATLARYEDQMLEAAAARGMAIEFNTRFLYRDADDDQKHRYYEANRRLLRKAKERGIGIAIGSDAHSPKDQGGAFEAVLTLLDELEINELVFPIAGRLARVALRYVKPAEPEPPPAPPEPEPVAVAAAPAVEHVPDVAAPDADEPAAVPAAKPVRKARAGASSTRAKETSSERSAARHTGDAPFEAPPAADAAPADRAPADAASAPAAAPASTPEPVADSDVASAEPDAPPVLAPVKSKRPKKAPAPEPVVAAEAVPSAPVAVEPAPAPAAPKAVSKPKPVPAKAEPPKAVAPPKTAAPKTLAPPKVPAKAVKAPPKPAPRPPAKPKAVAKAKAGARPAAKPVAKKAAVKAAPAKKSPAKKVAPLKAVAKKAAPKKTVAKKAAPKKPVRAAAKAPAKKAPAKKQPARVVAKRAPAKKAAARKPIAKKAAPKKSAAKRR
jgi:HisJ family histidinol phosphate phosphatase